MTSLWRTRNITRELFHEMVRRLRRNGISAERLFAEIDAVYEELLDIEDAQEIQAAVVPKGWQ